jgi:hypothetical protein
VNGSTLRPSRRRWCWSSPARSFAPTRSRCALVSAKLSKPTTRTGSCATSARSPSRRVHAGDVGPGVQLTARRLGRQVLLRNACSELDDLLTLTGLRDVLPSCVDLPAQSRGHAEQREQTLGVEEEGDPGAGGPGTAATTGRRRTSAYRARGGTSSGSRPGRRSSRSGTARRETGGRPRSSRVSATLEGTYPGPRPRPRRTRPACDSSARGARGGGVR